MDIQQANTDPFEDRLDSRLSRQQGVYLGFYKRAISCLTTECFHKEGPSHDFLFFPMAMADFFLAKGDFPSLNTPLLGGHTPSHISHEQAKQYSYIGALFFQSSYQSLHICCCLGHLILNFPRIWRAFKMYRWWQKLSAEEDFRFQHLFPNIAAGWHQPKHQATENSTPIPMNRQLPDADWSTTLVSSCKVSLSMIAYPRTNTKSSEHQTFQISYQSSYNF